MGVYCNGCGVFVHNLTTHLCDKAISLSISKMKMYVIVSDEAVKASNGNRGKMSAQCGHGFVGAFMDSQNRFPDSVSNYVSSGGMAKIVLHAPQSHLLVLYKKYMNKCGVSLITDEGLTVFKEPTITCLGIGPILPDDREDLLKSLKVFI